jgi:apolipoprotein N-acyltransferase
MLHKLLAIAAWSSMAFIAYATLSPIQARPIVASADLEHVAAFAVAGVLFGLAYPRRIILVCPIVLGSAVLLEYLQTLTPDRHGTAVDAVEKIAGGVLGICVATAAHHFWSRNRST